MTHGFTQRRESFIFNTNDSYHTRFLLKQLSTKTLKKKIIHAKENQELR